MVFKWIGKTVRKNPITSAALGLAAGLYAFGAFDGPRASEKASYEPKNPRPPVAAPAAPAPIPEPILELPTELPPLPSLEPEPVSEPEPELFKLPAPKLRKPRPFDRLVEIALQEYGKWKDLPYVWGGESPYPPEKSRNDPFFQGALVSRKQPGGSWRAGQPTVEGFDCSGFVWYAGKLAGIRPFTDVRATANAYMNWSSAESVWDGEYNDDMEKGMKPGDLVFVRGSDKRARHVAIYLGSGRIVESCGSENPDSMNVTPEQWNKWRSYAKPGESGRTDWDRGGLQISPLSKYSSRTLSVRRY